MKHLMFCVLLVSALTLPSGCGKHASPSATQTSSVQNVPAVTTNAGGTGTNAEPDLAELSRQLRGWIVGHRRLPKDFDEFASTANIKVPPPPPGKKYAIVKSTVILVDHGTGSYEKKS